MVEVRGEAGAGRVGQVPVVVEAGLWGLAGGAALVVGAAVAWFAPVPRVVIAGVMAFGAGVLISALAFELVQDAAERGGALATAGGFLAGAVVYVAASAVLDRRGARHRKRSGGQQPSEAEQQGSGAAIALGALLDGVPESVVLGLGLVGGGSVSPAVLAAIVISNVPEGLSSAAGMRAGGRSAGYVFGVWGGIAGVSGLAAVVGYALLADASGTTVAVITALAAGAILAMLANTMLPEAFDRAHVLTGLITAVGFLTAFGIQQAGG